MDNETTHMGVYLTHGEVTVLYGLALLGAAVMCGDAKSAAAMIQALVENVDQNDANKMLDKLASALGLAELVRRDLEAAG